MTKHNSKPIVDPAWNELLRPALPEVFASDYISYEEAERVMEHAPESELSVQEIDSIVLHSQSVKGDGHADSRVVLKGQPSRIVGQRLHSDSEGGRWQIPSTAI